MLMKTRENVRPAVQGTILQMIQQIDVSQSALSILPYSLTLQTISVRRPAPLILTLTWKIEPVYKSALENLESCIVIAPPGHASIIVIMWRGSLEIMLQVFVKLDAPTTVGPILLYMCVWLFVLTNR